MKSIWSEKDVVIVEGAGSRLGVGNDLLNEAKSVKRIICPIKDAFSKYKEILAECLKQDKNSLFIMALGPTATVLAEDLSNNGYRALDMGHLDTAYEAFLRNSNKFVHIEGKIVFNEERHNNLLNLALMKIITSKLLQILINASISALEGGKRRVLSRKGKFFLLQKLTYLLFLFCLIKLYYD